MSNLVLRCNAAAFLKIGSRTGYGAGDTIDITFLHLLVLITAACRQVPSVTTRARVCATTSLRAYVVIAAQQALAKEMPLYPIVYRLPSALRVLFLAFSREQQASRMTAAIIQPDRNVLGRLQRAPRRLLAQAQQRSILRRRCVFLLCCPSSLVLQQH